ncbi:probable E3 ubiquitin-protein ligase RHB1A [Gastrolobium bilobum]|uniref:probable E3 ubiquitin-protein ligase RHB1A n=1 Tax=Gastrolobium bilobum TaxID=150636 RepID=UPI002AAFE6AA|nr:probable E3 ubiquitin-protein ligase RHB1A [Gastrolobium bilobum]XP_061337291.1 probable E3 ubiquitin-protein ligase RHB1A [Gastrolobium bilobum]
MGGCCCCCSSRETELSAPPPSYYYPRVSEEHVPLSSHHGAAPSFSGGLLVDTNLDTSSPDIYRPPPAPIPFNGTLGFTQTPPMAQEICEDKTNASLLTTNSNPIQETVAGDNHGTSTKSEELKESDCKVQTAFELDTGKDSEIGPPKMAETTILVKEEDECPICLEEYDAENPKLSTKCDHHFHLACILEWMERCETCPVCDQDTVFNLPID